MDQTSDNRALQEIFEILKSADNPKTAVPPTLLYNEDWMLRLALAAAARGISSFPFQFAPSARWFSEARLYTRFAARYQGDDQAETPSHADGVVGHFSFALDSKTGLRLSSTGSQFLVLEAKIFSKLAERTKNIPNYNQATRTIGCMAHTLSLCGKPLSEWQSLAFFVVAPQQQIDKGLFELALRRESILSQIHDRIENYEPEIATEMHDWENQFVKPLVERIQIDCVSWEEITKNIGQQDKKMGESISRFYELTLKFNASKTAGKGIPGQPFEILPF